MATAEPTLRATTLATDQSPSTELADQWRTLTRAALWALKHLFKPGYAYQKAGVMLMELRDAGVEQGQLFNTAPPDRPVLMQVIDRANAQWGRGTLRLASEGMNKPWQMRREHASPAYTTRWEDLPQVN